MADENEELVFQPDEEGSEDIKQEEIDEEVLEVMEDDEEDDDDDYDEAGEEDKTAELEKRYMALFAEYENFRKRSAKEKEDLYASAIATVTKDWLAVLDNIDRALEQSKNADEASVEKVVQGIEMIGKQAGDVLTKLGVKEIECGRGTPFDPNLHEAVMHIDDEELGEQEVAAVFQKGYIYKDRVVRHAVVQVAN
ncbi:MAG: nucleotide exchange factor GrpE [Clostridiales bacterium]|nr:nucleotide exchange factor GrpE [Clostridiales bacterium]